MERSCAGGGGGGRSGIDGVFFKPLVDAMLKL